MTPSGPAGRDGSRAPAGGAAGGTRRWRLVRAGTDAVPSSARRFMRRARQRRLRAALPWALGAAGLALVGVLAWVVYGTGVFGVRTVRVAGADIATVADVRRAAAVPDGVPLARVDLAAVRARVQALPPVDRVVVSRDWPRAVLVQVVERTAVMAVPQGADFRLVDDDAVVFHSLPRRPAHLPLVRLAQPGPADGNTRAAVKVLAALTDDLREQLVALSVEGPARISLELRQDRRVIWGDATENDTKAKVATALLAREGKVIDVSAPEVVTIR